MKCYRLKIGDYGQYGDSRIKMISPGLSVKAFTAKSEALRAFSKQLQTFIEGNYRYSLRLELVETPATVPAAMWLQYFETGIMPVKVHELIRYARGYPESRWAA